MKKGINKSILFYVVSALFLIDSAIGLTTGNELNPETNLVAFSLKIANNTPIITNGITKIIHDQNPIFIIHTSS